MSKIPNLKEIYDSDQDVKEGLIPEEWQESFNRFMWGQTCYINENPDGTKTFLYFARDFRRWYHQNKEQIEKQIERDNKIESILK